MRKSLPKYFRIQRSPAALLAIFLVLLLINLTVVPQISNSVKAGTMSNASVTISNSRSVAASTSYTFVFNLANTTAVDHWTIQFCQAASGTCNLPGSMVTTGATRSSDDFTDGGAPATRTDDFTSNGTLKTTIDDPATQTGSPYTRTVVYTGITNPASSSNGTTFYARINTYSDATTVIDSSTVAFAILKSNALTLTATVDASFTFAMAGIAATGTVNSTSINVDNSSNPEAVAFGTLSVGSSKVAAEDLTVSTNAASGYAVTLKADADPPLVDGSNNIDKFTGSSASYASPATWAAPTSSTGNTNTGYIGYTTEDSDESQFGSNKWAPLETTARTIVTSSTPVSSETTRIGFQVQVDGYQPQGSYSGTARLIATPTY